MAMMIVVMPAPRPAISSIARISVGNDISTSTSRWLTRSNRPPMYAVITPSRNPSASPSSTAENATNRLTRVPYSSRL